MNDYTIGIERLIGVEAENEEEAIQKAHDQFQKQPLKSEELKVLEEVEQ